MLAFAEEAVTGRKGTAKLAREVGVPEACSRQDWVG